MGKEKVVFLSDRRKKVHVEPPPGAYSEQALLFSMGGESYAFPVRRIVEILPHQPLIDISRRDTPVEGVLNVRGRIIPIVDLGRKLGKIPSRQAVKYRIVVIDLAGLMVGMLVDEVAERLCLLSEAPAELAAERSDSGFLKGQVKIDGKFVPILDPDYLLSELERQQIESVKRSF